jgi:membrane-associated protein
MSLNDFILLVMVQYGLPVLFGGVFIAAVGVPLPRGILLITAGSFIALDEWPLGGVIILSLTAAMAGDVMGYMIGRWGSDALVSRVSRWGGGEERLQQAEDLFRRWGGIGIFNSRWLMSPIGPVVNLTSGLTHYPPVAFFILSFLGEALWVVLYVGFGWMFSNQIQVISNVISNWSGIMVGLVVMVVLVQLLRRFGRNGRNATLARERSTSTSQDKTS